MNTFTFIPRDNWTDTPMAFKEEENSMNSSVIQLLQDFHGVPFGLHFIGIPLHLLGLVQQIIIVIYERNELDPMKRSLTSQVSEYLSKQYHQYDHNICFTQMISTHMMWASNLSMITILRSLLHLVTTNLPLPILIFIEYLMVTYTIALTLVYITTNFFEYWSQFILRRIPNYDHDFLATGLQVTIFGLAFYLGALQTFGLLSVTEFEEKPLLIPSGLAFVVCVQAVIFAFHKLIKYYQTFQIPVAPQAWQPMPTPNQSVILQIQNLPPNNVPLNTDRFNPSVHTNHTDNLLMAIGFSICLVILVALSHEDFTGFHGYLYNLWSCFAIPFIFCSLSPKLRGFIVKKIVQ